MHHRYRRDHQVVTLSTGKEVIMSDWFILEVDLAAGGIANDVATPRIRGTMRWQEARAGLEWDEGEPPPCRLPAYEITLM